MYLDIFKHPEASHFKLIDIDTGEEIPDVQWADDAEGTYGQLRRNDSGGFVVETGRDLCSRCKQEMARRELVVDVKKGRIKLVDMRV